MVDVSLCGFVVDTVKELNIAHRSECCNGENLSLTSCEHTRAVNAAEKVNLCVKGTNLVYSSAVNTLALVKEPASYNELLEFIHTVVYLCYVVGIFLVKLSMNSLINGLESFVTNSLIVCVKSCLNIVNCKSLDSLEHLG